MSNVQYRRHNIRTMKQTSDWAALAFRGKTAVGPRQTGSTEEAAILAVKDYLDSAHEENVAQRGTDGYPTANDVESALARVDFTPAQRAMLTAHFWAPEHIMTATALAEAGGYDSYSAVNSQYGLLGRKLSEELDWQPPLIDGVRTWTYTLATGADEAEPGDAKDLSHWRWKLRPQIVDALRSNGQAIDPKR